MADSNMIEVKERIELAAKPTTLVFNVSSPFYGLHANNTILYRLNKIDTVLRKLPLTGQASFSRLPAGSYELTFSKQAGFGNKMIEKRIPFVIHPGFYETIFFKIMMILTGSTLLFLMFRARVMYLIRQRNKLEKEVEERTLAHTYLIEDLRATVSELEASNNELAKQTVLQEQLAMIITHDMQSPLRFLSDVAKRLHLKATETNNGTITELSGDIQRSSASIYHFVRQFGLWLNAFVTDFRLQYTRLSLGELIHELGGSLMSQLKARHNTLVIRCPDGLYVDSDRQLLEIILRNLLDNANKYSNGGLIKVDVLVNAGEVSIIVEDEGLGIHKEKLGRLKVLLEDPYSSYFKPERGEGYGFRFISVFCQLLNIKMKLDSVTFTRTTISLTGLKESKKR